MRWKASSRMISSYELSSGCCCTSSVICSFAVAILDPHFSAFPCKRSRAGWGGAFGVVEGGGGGGCVFSAEGCDQDYGADDHRGGDYHLTREWLTCYEPA